MQTFLQSNIHYSRSFVICGKLDECFCGNDLKISSFESYLVELLKSRGYSTIVFFEPRRGAYCLDEKSARSFFNENKHLPDPQVFDPERPEDDGNQNAVSDSAGAQLNDSKDIRRLAEAQTSDSSAKPSSTINNDRPADRRLVVAKKRQDIFDFIEQANSALMRDGNRFVAVFSNINTTDLSIPVLCDLVSHGVDNSDGLILFLARESFFSNDTMQKLGDLFGNRFIYREGNHFELNPRTCIRIGFPEADEIKNLLRRYSIRGTGKGNEKGYRIEFDEADLDEIATRILRYSRAKAYDRATFDNGEEGFLKIIDATIAQYVEEYAKTHSIYNKPLKFTPHTIDVIWKQTSTDDIPPIDKLDREGWGNTKEIVEKAVNLYKRQAKENGYNEEDPTDSKTDIATKRFESRLFESSNNKLRPDIPNFVLLGPKGTGKTTIARCIGAVLKESGILKTGHLVETTKKDFVSPYFGGVATETSSRIDDAEEGVLFIDEAHAIAYEDGGANNEGSGRTIISILNNAMTNRTGHHFSLILAGYTEEMEKLWELDEGFKGRFRNFIYLEDYPPELLKKILKERLEEKGYCFDSSITEKHFDEKSGVEFEPFQCMVERIYQERDISRFANARAMENIAEMVEMNNPDKSAPLTEKSFYGQYEDIRKKAAIDSSWFYPKNLNETCEYVLNEFTDRYVGMEKIRRKIEDIAVGIEEAKATGKPVNEKGFHFVICGNPGTGKTSVAETLARVLYSLGAVGNPELYKVKFSSLTGAYRGDTGENVSKVVDRAVSSQSLLFIDEAHNLCDPDYKGVISNFMAPLEDYEKPLNICFAVYKDRLDDFIALDPGLLSRMEIIELDDYSAEELYQIFIKNVENEGLFSDEEFMDMVRRVLEKKSKGMSKRDGNARFITRTFLPDLDSNRKRRCKETGIPFASEDAMRLIIDDIPKKYRVGIDFRNPEEYRTHLWSIMDEIDNERTGNKELKDVLKSKIKALIYNSQYGDSAVIIEPGHYFFKGSPGSGKTTGADFFAKYLYKLGLTETPELKKRSAKDLIGEYLGQTGAKTGNLLEGSRGSVLLIDEAYALAQTGIGDGDTYKLDAINEIVGMLDDDSFRRTTSVIFAGYSGDLDLLYSKNEGMRSRIKEINFSNFTTDECMEILRKFISDSNMILSDEAAEMCRNQFREIANSKDFQNGRTVRKYAEFIKDRMIDRVITDRAGEPHSDDWGRTVLPEDIADLSEILGELKLN